MSNTDDWDMKGAPPSGHIAPKKKQAQHKSQRISIRIRFLLSSFKKRLDVGFEQQKSHSAKQKQRDTEIRTTNKNTKHGYNFDGRLINLTRSQVYEDGQHRYKKRPGRSNENQLVYKVNVAKETSFSVVSIVVYDRSISGKTKQIDLNEIFSFAFEIVWQMMQFLKLCRNDSYV